MAKNQQQDIKILSVEEYMWGYVVEYIGPRSAIIDANIVPPEFFNFGEQKTRQIASSWFERRTGKKCPERIENVCGAYEERDDTMTLEVWIKGTEPFYVPPGDTWPSENDPRLVVRGISYKRLSVHDEPLQAGDRISTGFNEEPDGSFRVRFSSTPARLIAAGLALPSMFPLGCTATGRKRERKIGHNRLGSFLVTTRNEQANLWWGSLPAEEREFFEEVRKAHQGHS